ncbi:hypothetical protein J4E86_008310 [Alternaria arbusti]|uniref:uncharacterized protein n=1 Tax=Alternaria arbusti TaxID=232088 RepID=UPI00221F5DF5|nr:uncharacterized protein J4E86_008310 [Alternaria arbusti]KAI4947794.1 hypothetical protein J4E86_008310 [Alternaria arbusti]
MDAKYSDLLSVPWAAALINDPNWTPMETSSRSVKPSGEDSFFAGTLGTDRTITTLLTFRPKNEETGDIAYKEIKTIVELGDGLQGYPRIAHGGFQATLLDEMSGVLIGTVMEKKAQRDGRRAPVASYVTAYLNTTYKKPAPTLQTLLCTAKIERIEDGGRKLYARATLEDGNGTIYTIAEGMFIRLSTKL